MEGQATKAFPSFPDACYFGPNARCSASAFGRERQQMCIKVDFRLRSPRCLLTLRSNAQPATPHVQRWALLERPSLGIMQSFFKTLCTVQQRATSQPKSECISLGPFSSSMGSATIHSCFSLLNRQLRDGSDLPSSRFMRLFLSLPSHMREIFRAMTCHIYVMSAQGRG